MSEPDLVFCARPLGSSLPQAVRSTDVAEPDRVPSRWFPRRGSTGECEPARELSLMVRPGARQVQRRCARRQAVVVVPGSAVVLGTQFLSSTRSSLKPQEAPTYLVTRTALKVLRPTGMLLLDPKPPACPGIWRITVLRHLGQEGCCADR